MNGRRGLGRVPAITRRWELGVVVAHIVAVGGGGFFVLDFGVEEDVDCRCASGKGKRRRKTPGHFHGVVMILSSSGLLLWWWRWSCRLGGSRQYTPIQQPFYTCT